MKRRFVALALIATVLSSCSSFAQKERSRRNRNPLCTVWIWEDRASVEHDKGLHAGDGLDWTCYHCFGDLARALGREYQEVR